MSVCTVVVTQRETRHEPICSSTSRFFITGDAATPRSEVRVPQRFTKHGSRSSPSPSWRPERYRLVPENPMEGQYAFIEQHSDSYPRQMLCTALQVSDSGFTSWQRSDGP